MEEKDFLIEVLTKISYDDIDIDEKYIYLIEKLHDRFNYLIQKENAENN